MNPKNTIVRWGPILGLGLLAVAVPADAADVDIISVTTQVAQAEPAQISDIQLQSDVAGNLIVFLGCCKRSCHEVQ